MKHRESLCVSFLLEFTQFKVVSSFCPPPGPGVWIHHHHRPEAAGAQHRVHRQRGADLPRDGGPVALR